MKAKAYIYKVTSLVNGKSYIGQHDGSKPHYYASGTVLKRAIEKHGKHNFMREIIVEGHFSKEELDELEVEYIKKFKTYAYDYPDSGYNYTRGGSGKRGHKQTDESRKKMSLNSSRSKAVVQLTMQAEYVASYPSCIKAAAATGAQCSSVYRACDKQISHCGGFRWMWQREYCAGVKIAPLRTLKKRVGCLDENGIVFAEFESAGDAARLLGVNRAGIANVLCGNSKIAQGVRWVFV